MSLGHVHDGLFRRRKNTTPTQRDGSSPKLPSTTFGVKSLCCGLQKKTNILPALITSSYPYIPKCKDPPRFIFREENLATQEEFSLSLFPAPPLE